MTRGLGCSTLCNKNQNGAKRRTSTTQMEPKGDQKGANRRKSCSKVMPRSVRSFRIFTLFPPQPRWWVLVFKTQPVTHTEEPPPTTHSPTSHQRLHTNDFTPTTSHQRLHTNDFTQTTYNQHNHPTTRDQTPQQPNIHNTNTHHTTHTQQQQ